MTRANDEKESAIARQKIEELKETLLKQCNGAGKELPIAKEALKDELLIAWLNEGLKQSNKRRGES